MEPTAKDVEKKFFLWNNPAVAEFGLDKEAILTRTLALLRRPEDTIEWCL